MLVAPSSPRCRLVVLPPPPLRPLLALLPLLLLPPPPRPRTPSLSLSLERYAASVRETPTLKHKHAFDRMTHICLLALSLSLHTQDMGFGLFD